MNQSFTGAWPALITPATGDGDVNLAVLRDLVEYLLGKQADGLYVCGSTGEGLWMSVPERQQTLETVIKQVHGRVPVIAHVGSVATRDAVLLAKHAQEQGADGVSSVLPVLQSGLDNIYLHYGAIAAAVPDLPFFPYLFGRQTDAAALMRNLLQRIPNVGGAKYTGPNMFEFKQLVELGAGRNWTIFSGMDEQCLFALMFGAPGNIGSTLNVMPAAYREIRRLYHSGEIACARDLQARVNRVTGVLIDFGFSGALRAGMRLLGFDCGEPRWPILPLAPDRQDVLHGKLEEAGWTELTSM